VAADPLDAREIVLEQLAAADLAPANRAGEVEGGAEGDVLMSGSLDRVRGRA
jgi:hypothetical protein